MVGNPDASSSRSTSNVSTRATSRRRVLREALTSDETSFRSRLARLTPQHAAALLGEHGSQLLARGALREIRLKEDVYLGSDLYRVTFPGVNRRRPEAIVTVTASPIAHDRLQWRCSACSSPCEHAGAALSFLLEEKTSLGLAVAPSKYEAAQPLTEEELFTQALADRAERAQVETMKVETSDPATPWADYTVTSALSGKSYRVALRGSERGESYCSCPDFRINTLGTCKHVMHTLETARKKFSAEQFKKPYRVTTFSVAVHYGRELELRLLIPDKLDDEAAAIAEKLRGQPIDDVRDLLKRMRHLERLGHPVNVYPDAEEFIQQKLFQEQTAERMAEIRRDPASHPLRTSLLKTELLPYQLDGIAFAVAAGRAVLADEMGLGKTIQGVGAAELFAREADIKRVLVVCPTSLKSQWRSEIERFSERTVQIVSGSNVEREPQYTGESFFTICNYEQVLKDIVHIEQTTWDLIILDEGQRIKNWESKTTRVIKGLRSRFALVLSGTPLENRLEELFSVVQFIDDRRLGPGFRFFHHHRVVDESGKVIGFKNLANLRETLKPILLRRTRDSVKQQLPPRTNEIIRIPPTSEQAELSAAHLQNVRRITSKRFLTEMDLLLLQKELLLCRMAADSTYLVDKVKPGFSSKLAALDELLERLFDEDDRKAILFSEWKMMLDLIEPLLRNRKLPFVRLDGSVPQKKRQEIVDEFQRDADCKLFLTTNAGSTGLNLQVANTVINVDLPWNPAVLEQRIARAYRMGQSRAVDVYILVTEDTLEERLLSTLAAKQDLALAALDAESDVDEVTLETGMGELKQRLEILIGSRTETMDHSSEGDQEPGDRAGDANNSAAFEFEELPGGFAIVDRATSSDEAVRRERISVAGGQLLSGAIALLGELLPSRSDNDASRKLAESLKQGLADYVQRDERGQLQLTFTLPDASALNTLADSLARLLTR